ncbi:hypothetical protein DRP07_07540 [Archaeoglobales archaeon]|nr:MAG: hypothetical protein DRP07_07540 [Archaeoglobales archaeon]
MNKTNLMANVAQFFVSPRFIEESFKTFTAINETFWKFFDVSYFFKELKEEEIEESFSKITSFYAELLEFSLKFWKEIFDAVQKGDPDEVVKTYLFNLSELEDIYARRMDNMLIIAYLDEINKAYLTLLNNLQSVNNAIFHSLGLVTRRDVVALSEAYVDLKGDIKKESRKIRREIQELRKSVERIERRGEEK